MPKLHRRSTLFFFLAVFIMGIWGVVIALQPTQNDPSPMPTLARIIDTSIDKSTDAIEVIDFIDNDIESLVYELDVSQSPVINQFVLEFSAESSADDISAYIASLNLELVNTSAELNRVVVIAEANTIETLSSDLIISTERDYYAGALFTLPPTDPLYEHQWNLEMIGAPDAWAQLPTNIATIRIAMIDSGMCFDHPDMQGNYSEFQWDYVEDDALPQDEFGHGCAVTSLIASQNNDIGLMGITPFTEIMPLRVLDAKGIGTYSDIAQAIVDATNQGAQIINLSLGGYNASSMLKSAVDYALAHDVFVVAATGNTGQSTPLYPAAYEGVIAVGSVNSDGQISSFSNRDEDSLAPGEAILVPYLDDDYVYMSGTSLAAPHVTGVIALELALGHEPIINNGIISLGADLGEPAPSPEPFVDNNEETAGTESNIGEAQALQVFSVNSTSDTNDGTCDISSCSLREAIIAANAYGVDAVVSIPAGTYTLSINGTGEDGAATGDLDITANIRIAGAGREQTIIDANGIDRVFDMRASAAIEFLSVTGGIAPNSEDGGGIRMDSSTPYSNLDLFDVAIYGNSTSASGGGISIDNNSASLIFSEIYGNTATNGAGINFVDGYMALSETHIHDNDATANGGGLFINAPFSLLDWKQTAIVNNTANNGGGVYSTGTGSFYLFMNTTLSGNLADNHGGGLYIDEGSFLNYFATIADNTADADNSGTGDGGGVYINSGEYAASSSILAGNHDLGGEAPDCRTTINGAVNSLSENLIGDPLGCDNFINVYFDPLFLDRDYIGFDPQLVALADNGGNTLTHALSASSTAIDNGSLITCSFLMGQDQRSSNRDFPYSCDIGAYEFTGSNGDIPLKFLSLAFESTDDGLDLDLMKAYNQYFTDLSQTVTFNTFVDFEDPGDIVVLRFNQSLYDPYGDTNYADATNLLNYQLVSSGSNATFETTSCSVAGDDVLIELEDILVNNFFTEVYILIKDSYEPVTGSYRMVMCNLEAGNHLGLDGNGDGTTGDPAIFDFDVLDQLPTQVYLFTNYFEDTGFDDVQTLSDYGIPVILRYEFDYEFDYITAEFTQAVNSVQAADPNNFLIVNFGADETFQTNSCIVQGDDQVTSITDINYEVTTDGFDDFYRTTLIPQSPLINGVYRVIVCDDIENLAGDPIDGDGDNALGGHHIAEFLLFTKPINVEAISSDGSVNLTWSDINISETGFGIWRKTASSNWEEIGTVGANVTSFIDNNVTCYSDYSYRLQSRRDLLWSGYTDNLDVTVDCSDSIFVVNSTSDTNDGTCGIASCSLREAIIAANAYGDGALVSIPAGTYTLSIAGTGEDASATGDLDITENIRIVGAGRDATVIDANGIDRVFDISAPAIIENLSITGGIAPNGEDGGGIRVTNGSQIDPVYESLRIFDLGIYDNSTTGDGGGISAELIAYRIKLINSEIYQNSATNGAGISFGDYAYIGIRETYIHDNDATAKGGGIYYNNTGYWAGLEKSTIANNTAENGGGIYVNGNYYLIANTTISGNQANSDGGGIYAAGGITSSFSTITNNTADANSTGVGDGGGVYLGTSLMESTIIFGNHDNGGEAPDCSTAGGEIWTNFFNMIGDISGCDNITPELSDNFFFTRDYFGIDPQLGSLADNGGNTPSHAIPEDSLAVDRGRWTYCFNWFGTDQRSAKRDPDSRCDIGAYEYTGSDGDSALTLKQFSLINTDDVIIDSLDYDTYDIIFTHDDIINSEPTSNFGFPLADKIRHFVASGDNILVLGFNQSIHDPYGDSAPTDATNLSNYQLVSAGINDNFDTASCILGGDDVLIELEKIVVDNLFDEVFILLKDSLALPIGNYRLVACNLEAGNRTALDGNDDGTTGDPIIYDFTVISDAPTRLDLYTEYHTDSIYEEWQLLSQQPLSVRFEFDYVFNYIDVGFSEPVSSTQAEDLSNYLIVDFGADETFQTDSCSVQGDDQVIPISDITYGIGTRYEQEAYIATLIPQSPLINGVYRIIVCDDIEDLSGDPIDGNNDRLIGGNHIAEFLLFPKPINVGAIIGNGGVHLTWSDINISETGFGIWRKTASSSWQDIGAVGENITSFNDNTATCGTEYSYRLQSRRDLLWSGYTEDLDVTVDCSSGTFIVNSTSDTNDGTCDTSSCSLREAIIAANAYGDGAVVSVPAGTYTLSIAGTGEDASATGDLDITANIHIVGAGRDQTIIDANGIDRVFDIFSRSKIEYLTVQNGQPENGANGGGLLINLSSNADDEIIILNGLKVFNNTALSGTGGGLAALGTDGGDIFEGFTTYISYSVFADNSAVNGGGIAVEHNAHLLLSESAVDGNNASNNGGGIYYFSNHGPITSLSTIANNTAQRGGGLYLDDTAHGYIWTSTISGNSATEDGGGLYFDPTSDLGISYSTISDNVADSDFSNTGHGGGIYMAGSHENSVASMTNIIAGNIDQSNIAPDCYTGNSVLTSLNRNLIGDTTGCLVTTHEYGQSNQYDYLNVDPLLSSLAYNGGYNESQALQINSPAIDNAPLQACHPDFGYNDQRGIPRNLDMKCDIGAFEYDALATFPNSPQIVALGIDGIGIYNSYIQLTSTINTLELYLNKSLKDHIGNIHTSDVTNVANYLLVADGTNGEFDTSTCGIAQGDDINIALDLVKYFQAGNAIFIDINGGVELPGDSYRMIVCNLVDQENNPMLDDFVSDFIVGDTLTVTVTGVPYTEFIHEYDVPQNSINAVFNRDAMNPAGDSNSNDVTNPNNYHIVTDGADGIFQTDSCSLQGDDQPIGITNIEYFTSGFEKYSTVNLAIPLIDDSYRLVVCDEIEDMSNQPLDGDHNGIVGGDYVTEFIVFPKPINVTGTLGTGEIIISWDDLASSETGYAIERRENISGTGWKEINIVGADATSYVDNTPACSTEYVYRVQTRRSTDEVRSGYSDEIVIDFDCTPLVEPDNLVATAVSGTHINLTWNDNNGIETAYKIERRLSVGGTFVEIGESSANSTSYSDTLALCETDYDYRVRAYRSTDNSYSDYSNVVSGKLLCPLVPPSALGVNTVIGQKRLDLTWTDNSLDETEFRIQRLISGTWTHIDSVTADETSFSENSLLCYTTYDYRVIGFRSSDSALSLPSAVASGTTSCTTVTAPRNLTGTVNETTIALTWIDNSPDEDNFQIQRGVSGTWTTIGTSPANTATFIDLTTVCGDAYGYRVRAQRSGTDSPFSNEIVIQQTCPPPPAPSNLTLTALPFSNDIQLDWTDNSNTETDFYIERSTDDSSWEEIASVSENVVTYTDTDASLSCYTPYYYHVQAYRSSDGVPSAFSTSTSISTWCDPDLLSDVLNPITENETTLNISGVTGFPEPSCASGMNHAYIWEFPAIDGSVFNLNTFGSSINTVMSVWQFDGTNFNQIACNDDSALDGTSALVSGFPLGSRYLVIVGGKNNANDNITLHSSLLVPPTATPLPTATTIPTATSTPDLTTVGVFKDGIWQFRDSNTTGSSDLSFRFGSSLGADWIPLIGDWDGDGNDGIGLYKDGRWYLRELASGGSSADYVFRFGANETGWQPVVGDWDGDGVDGIGLYKNGTWMLKNSPSSGDADYNFRFNVSGSNDAIAIAGDWHDEGVDRVGLYYMGRWYLSYEHRTSNTAKNFQYGPTDGLWQPIVGDWDEDGDDSIGVYKDGGWRLRNSNTRGNPDLGLSFGVGDKMPIAGYRGSVGSLALFASVADFDSFPTLATEAPDEPLTVTATMEVTDEPMVDATSTPTSSSTIMPTNTATLIPTITPSSTWIPTFTPTPTETVTQALPSVPENVSGS